MATTTTTAAPATVATHPASTLNVQKRPANIEETVLAGSKSGSSNASSSSVVETGTEHYKDWPNDAGFNAAVEQRTPRSLKVTGEFPAWVAGSLYRTGPGLSRIPRANNAPDFEIRHWFDGFTHMHKFTIASQDTVTYTSRGQVDDLIEHARATGTLAGFSFGQKRDPCDSFYKKFKTVFEKRPTNPALANIGVVVRPTVNAFGGKSVADTLTVTTDAQTLKEFDPETLEPLGVIQQSGLHQDLVGPLSGAHAQTDVETGDVINYNLDLGRKPTYRVFRTSKKTGQTDILATLSGPDVKASYVHSMFLTENYVVLCVWPLHFLNYGAKVLWDRNILDSMQFEPSLNCTWFVVDRRNARGLVSKFTSPAMFAFHSINSWEEKRSDGNTDVFCEVSEYPNSDILHQFYYENLVSNAPSAKKKASAPRNSGIVARYRLPAISSIQNTSTQLQARPAEIVFKIADGGDLPSINPDFATKRHRYVYVVKDRGESSFLDALGKVDTANPAENLVWACKNHTPSEPIFIPDPQGTEEDDGVLLTVVLDGEAGTSYLLCLNAKDFSEVARAHVEAPVGFGFHGLHVPKI